MSIESRLTRLEDSTGMNGQCACPRFFVIQRRWNQRASEPTDAPVLCAVCGLPKLLIVVTRKPRTSEAERTQ